MTLKQLSWILGPVLLAAAGYWWWIRPPVPLNLQGIAFKPIYMSDAIHPNDDGYKLVADRLEKLLKPLLPHPKPN